MLNDGADMRESRLSGDVLISNPVILVHIQYNTLVAHVESL